MRTLICALLLAAALPAQAALPPTTLASVPSTGAKIHVDGALDDPAWKDAALLGPFVRADGGGMPTAATVARALAGPDRLTLGIRCEEPEMAKLQSAPAAYDAPIWTGDCVELFLQPDPKRPYLHFITNAHGARYDEREKDSSWNAEWDAAGRRDADARSAEIAIPWQCLGGRPASGAQWRLNVCRSRHPEMEASAWSATGGGFHEPERFGTLRFDALAWLADTDWGRPWTGVQQVRVRAGGAPVNVKVGASPAATVAPGEPVLVAYTAAGEDVVPLVLTAVAGKETVVRQVYLLRVEPVQPALQAAADALGSAGAALSKARLPRDVKAALQAGRSTLSERLAALRRRCDDPSLPRDGREALIPDLQRLSVEASHLALRVADSAASGRLSPYSLGTLPSLVKLLPVRPFSGPVATTLRLSAARNEVAAAQLVMVAHEDALKDVTLAIEGPAGERVPHLAWRRVGTVVTSKPTYAVEHVGEWPDPLLPPAPFELPAGGRATLWIDARVPAGTPAGEYRATVRVRVANAPERALPVTVRVRGFTIPREHHLRTGFGLGPGSDANWDEWMRNYLDHRISPYSPGGGAKVVRGPAFDWSGAKALLARLRTPAPVGLRLLLDTPQGRVASSPVRLEPGGWQEARFELPALEGPVSAFHFAVEPLGLAEVDLDDLRLEAAGGTRVLDACDQPDRWLSASAWARCAPAPDAAEGGGAVRWSVRPTQLAGWLDQWPLLTRAAGADADIPLTLDFSTFDAAVERYRPLGLDSFVVGLPGASREASEAEAAETVGRAHTGLLAAAWERHLKEKGWLDLGYTYLFDEPEPAHYPALNRVMGTVKMAAPGIRNMMTARAFPKELKYVDVWCPEVCSFDPEACRAEQARGKELWWYVAFSTRHPRPNFWTDYPALDCRVLFWMTWKHQMDGVLYWSATYWLKDPWKEPMTFPGANGDGSLLYPGPKKEPVDSIRWECIRDGIEDYEAFCLLEAARDALRGNRRAAGLVRQADELLRISDGVVTSYQEYSPDPSRLLAARTAMDDCLERCVALLGKEPVVTRWPRFPKPLPVEPLPPFASPAPAAALAELPPLPAAQPEAGLVARYDFSGPWPLAVDLSGSSNNGLVLGGERAEGPGGRPALRFSGDRDGVKLPGGAALLGSEPAEGTLAMWVRPDTDAQPAADGWSGHQVIAYLMLTDGNGLPDGYDEIGLHLHGQTLYARAGGLNQGAFAGIGFPLKRGEWTHLALTFAPGRRVLYVNGKPAAVREGAYPPPRLDGFPGALGYHPASNRWPFHGAVADTRIYRRALSEAEVAALAR